MHWTPIAGTTLLHLAIDFSEREIFDWLLAHGADVNARAAVPIAEGFGGHTPLFNAVVCGPWRRHDDPRVCSSAAHRRSAREPAQVSRLASKSPRWHEARDVTAAEWARIFLIRIG